MTHAWHLHHGLGDCWWHSLFLRKIGGSHIFYCKEQHHADLRDLLQGHDVELRPIQDHPPDSVNCWIGAECAFSWHANLCDRDLIKFLTESWFAGLSQQIGVENPFKTREDFLYDGISPQFRRDGTVVLMIDCYPRSGQCNGVKMEELDALVPAVNGRRVRDMGYSMQRICDMSVEAQCIFGVATGPIWPCLNILNRNIPIYLLLDQVFLDYGPNMHIEHFSTVADMAVALRRDGWIK